MPTSDITALVKGQLADTREWNVQKFSIGAEPDSLPSLQLGTNASMSKLYTGDVEMAKKLIDKIENGDVFNVDEYYEAEVKNIPNYNSFYKIMVFLLTAVLTTAAILQKLLLLLKKHSLLRQDEALKLLLPQRKK